MDGNFFQSKDSSNSATADIRGPDRPRTYVRDRQVVAEAGERSSFEPGLTVAAFGFEARERQPVSPCRLVPRPFEQSKKRVISEYRHVQHVPLLSTIRKSPPPQEHELLRPVIQSTQTWT